MNPFTFTNRFRCHTCLSKMDSGTDDMWTCTKCGDEYTPDSFQPDKPFNPGAYETPLGAGDIVTFRHRNRRISAVVVKVNRRSARVRHADSPHLIRMIDPANVLDIEYVNPTEEHDAA